MLTNTDQVPEHDSPAGFFFGSSDCCVRQAIARFYVTCRLIKDELAVVEFFHHQVLIIARHNRCDGNVR